MNRNASESRSSSKEPRGQQEFSRILSAAVVNARFRQALLNNPVQAISSGYWGEKFSLGNEERKQLASIRASSLADFASQLAQCDFSYSSASSAAD
jgi:hypothetical protein